ncbi:MAG: glycosyltransferase family 2 protein, partial [Vicinamibacteraceae bacterium]
TWLAFLNNDTEVEPDWLDRLVEAASSRPDVGAVTSRIVYMDDPRIIDSAGDGYLRAGGAFKRGHGDERARWGDGGEVFGACGAACMIRRDLFETLGGFDEAFFMTFEDVDLSYGIQLAGERCVYAPRAIVRHAGSASLGRLSRQAIFLGQRNLEWVYWKNTPWPLLLRSLPSHALYELAAAVHFARAGALGTFLGAKWAALVGVAGLLPKRRARQRLRRVSCRELWRRMEPGWLGIKLKEKPFDLVAARK